jgi:hypothetical protein
MIYTNTSNIFIHLDQVALVDEPHSGKTSEDEALWCASRCHGQCGISSHPHEQSCSSQLIQFERIGVYAILIILQK